MLCSKIPSMNTVSSSPVHVFFNRELTILGRERQPPLHKTKTAITEIKARKLRRNYNLKDLLSE